MELAAARWRIALKLHTLLNSVTTPSSWSRYDRSRTATLFDWDARVFTETPTRRSAATPTLRARPTPSGLQKQKRGRPRAAASDAHAAPSPTAPAAPSRHKDSHVLVRLLSSPQRQQLRRQQAGSIGSSMHGWRPARRRILHLASGLHSTAPHRTAAAARWSCSHPLLTAPWGVVGPWHSACAALRSHARCCLLLRFQSCSLPAADCDWLLLQAHRAHILARVFTPSLQLLPH